MLSGLQTVIRNAATAGMRVGDMPIPLKTIVYNELWPAQPVLDDPGFDHVFGANLMLPTGFEPRDISGWTSRRARILAASRQRQQGYHLETARRARDRLGDRLTPIDPIEPGRLRGVSFHELFIDHVQWPQTIRRGYGAAREALEPFRRPRALAG